MIARISAKPNVSAHFGWLAKPAMRFSLDLQAKGLRLSSSPIILDRAAEYPFWSQAVLEQRWATLDLLQKLADANTTLGKEIAAAGIRTPDHKDRRSAIEAAQSKFSNFVADTERLLSNPEFFTFIGSLVIPLNCSDSSEERSLAFHRGSVWSCSRMLEAEQWRVLIYNYVAREDADFARALSPQPEATSGIRVSIPSTVRRSVWNRDGGRCTRCGGRERLEYDHIIPVSRGGSNTERNIELLCETCNRAKSDSIL